jgi:hypothetical protein
MSEPTGEKPEADPTGKASEANESQKAIRQNLQNFLNPGLTGAPLQKPPDPKGALQLRMAQMELANKMRLNNPQTGPKAVPMHRSPPPGGFGSAQGVFHMRRGDFGKKPKPSAGKRSPYQQVLANSSKPSDDASNPQSEALETGVGANEEVIEIPEDAEVKQNQQPKRLRGKKFRNPTL